MAADKATEIYSIDIDGGDLQRLTENTFFDLYPAWSPDGSKITFLSWRGEGLDIYAMDADGSDQRLLFDSARTTPMSTGRETESSSQPGSRYGAYGVTAPPQPR